MEMINKKKMVDQKALVAIRSDYEILRTVFKRKNVEFNYRILDGNLI